MTRREIADAVLAAKGITDATTSQWRGVEAGIRACLEDGAGKTVGRIREGLPKRWALRP